MAYNKKIDTNEFEVGQTASVIIPSTGDIDRDDFKNNFEIVENIKQSQLEETAFMEEYLEVMVHETTDPNADPLPFVAVNGIAQTFVRGMIQRVKRKYINVLAMTKVGVVSTPLTKDRDGFDAYTLHTERRALKHNFQIISDPNPKGPAWLSQALKSAL